MNKQNDFKILVIDDNPEIYHDFLRILKNTTKQDKHLGKLEKKLFGEEDTEEALPTFQIDSASQGQEGVALIEEAVNSRSPYALAFVDIRMPPGWDGIETIKHIWKIDKDIQIVICTAYSDYTWEATIAELGQTDNLLILKKPFDNIAVRQLACALTQKWRLMKDSIQYTQSLEKNVKDRSNDLKKSHSLIRATLESSNDGIIVVDNDGEVIDFNNKFLTLLHIKKTTLEHNNFSTIVKQIAEAMQEKEKFLKRIADLNKNPESISINVIKLQNGKVFEYYSQPQKLADKTIGRVWSFRDITDRALLEEKLKHQASFDALTNLPNRVQVHQAIQNAIFQAEDESTQFAVMFLDLDRFKLINDSLSRETGDEVLRNVAARLSSSVRSTDVLARIGGDEFVLVIKNIKNPKAMIEIAVNLLGVISRPYHVFDRDLMLTTSIGISVYPKDGENADELLRNADTAMYNAKRTRPNHYQFYNDVMSKENLERLEMETELRRAIANNEFVLCYQPQFDISAEKLVAVEALIRWNHPTRGLILPLEFIPLAEETGLIIPIGEWALRTACKQNKAWQDAGLPPIRVAVNITSQQLHQYNLVKTIVDILRETALSPEYLELELTENTIISNTHIVDLIVALKAIGIRIALDDFGTGYSSLNYLRNIPIDRLKIDRSFVQNIQINRGDEVIIHAIIAMARSLNMEVLAEGVENQQQLNYLKSQKCGEIQGFYFSKPLMPEELEKMLGEKFNINQLLVKPD